MKKNKTQNQKGEPKQAIAQLRYLRIAPRKMRLIGAMIKKMSVNEAEAQLITTRDDQRKRFLKLLRSAVDKTQKGKNMDFAQNNVWEVVSTKVRALKRMMRARGDAVLLFTKDTIMCYCGLART
jgi:large subunit ribosomal protein L22